MDTGRPANRAISVNECSLPSVNVIRIEVILLVTERPDSVAFPANEISHHRGRWRRGATLRVCSGHSTGRSRASASEECWTDGRITVDAKRLCVLKAAPYSPVDIPSQPFSRSPTTLYR